MDSSEQPELKISQWVVSERARPWLELLEGANLRWKAHQTLRKSLNPEETSAVLQQADLRDRAIRKFGKASQMFFTDVGLQQSTDEVIAAYKAARFPTGQPIADLCCGIGGDLIALAKRGPTTAVDASADHLLFAESNVRANGAEVADTHCGLAETISLQQFAAWHIDPDRRPDKRRTIRLDSFSPSQDDLEAMLRQNRNAAMKLAPATSLPPQWEEEAECEWISHHRECKQLVAWFGELTQQPGHRRATRIDGTGQATSFVATPIPASPASELLGYLYDPDPSLVAAGLVDAISAELGLSRISPQSHYLTGSDLIDHPLLQCFVVLGQEKIDKKRLKKAIAQQNWGVLELKQRGLELKLEAWRNQLKPSGAGEGTIIFSPTLAGNRAILCRRESTAATTEG